MSDLFELVLVNRKNIYYRGKVIDRSEDHCVVFYIDYGYTEEASPSDIYHWDPRWSSESGTFYHQFRDANFRKFELKSG